MIFSVWRQALVYDELNILCHGVPLTTRRLQCTRPSWRRELLIDKVPEISVMQKSGKVSLKKSNKVNMSSSKSGLREENRLDFSNLQRGNSRDSWQFLEGGDIKINHCGRVCFSNDRVMGKEFHFRLWNIHYAMWWWEHCLNSIRDEQKCTPASQLFMNDMNSCGEEEQTSNERTETTGFDLSHTSFCERWSARGAHLVRNYEKWARKGKLTISPLK